jgi:hypothetical protein
MEVPAMRVFAPLALVLTTACAAPPSAGPDPAVARIDARLAAIESRLTALETAPPAIPFVVRWPTSEPPVPMIHVPTIFSPEPPPDLIVKPWPVLGTRPGDCVLPLPAGSAPAK